MLTESSSVVILHADDALLVLDKPAGLLSVPGRGPDKQDCLSARAQRRFADALVVHRLDMATSGLILMARGALAQRTLSRAFAERRVDKKYQALVHGRLASPGADWEMIDLPIALDWPSRPRRVVRIEGGKPSHTRWRVIASAASDQTRVELEPLTGRSHQLRVHMRALGHPIVGDALYCDGPDTEPACRLMLHATEIAFAHPATGRAMRFESRPDF